MSGLPKLCDAKEGALGPRPGLGLGHSILQNSLEYRGTKAWYIMSTSPQKVSITSTGPRKVSITSTGPRKVSIKSTSPQNVSAQL
ncbi:hypothetical protein STEG23_018264 [Scotinomys teguina]